MDRFSRQPADKRLFPTTESFFIFCSYISLFVSQGLLVTAVQRQQIQGFNAVIVVLLVEGVKLCICIAIYLLRSQSGGLAALLYDVNSNRKLLLLYLVPAFLYSLYNNLTFVNLSMVDVSTYYCLMQFRIVLTAIIYQILFRRQLTLSQWTSLLILTTGCLIKEYGLYHHQVLNGGNDHHQQSRIMVPESVTNETMNNNDSRMRIAAHIDQPPGVPLLSPVVKFIWSMGLLLFQMFCSCFAGVYNEYLLKDSATAKNADIIIQNIFMYLDSIVCNLVVLKISSSYLGHDILFSDIGYATILRNLLTSPLVIILIFNNAASGLVASFFLKSLNSILKTFASALELFAVTFLAWLLFNDKVDIYTLIALALVSLAIFVYSKDPVSVAPPDKTVRVENRDGFVPIPMEEN